MYSVFCAAFFPNHTALVMMLLYFGGIVVAVISGLIFKNTIFKGNSVPFVLELPVYRLPSFSALRIHLWSKVQDFISRAFTIIFLGSLIVWLLTNLTWGFHLAEDSSLSILASLGSFVAPLFALNGFDNWQAVAALVSGFTAKEAVISTLSVVLPEGLASYFTPLSAASFLVFTLLYTPCLAAVAAMRREFASLKWTAAAVGFQLFVAWFFSALAYTAGSIWI